MLLGYSPVRGVVKPFNTAGLRYDDGYWGRLGLPQPAGFWPMFGPGPQGKVKDYSPNGNDGTLTNSPTWSVSDRGTAIKTATTNDYVDLGTPASLQAIFGSTQQTSPTQPWGIGCWVNLSAQTTFSGIVQFNNAGLEHETLGQIGVVGTDNTMRSATATSTVTTGTWYYLFATFDGKGSASANYKIYVNAIDKTVSASDNNYNSTNKFRFMQGDTHSQGSTLQVVAFSVCPSLAQIQKLYTEPWGMFTTRDAGFAPAASGGGGGFSWFDSLDGGPCRLNSNIFVPY